MASKFTSKQLDKMSMRERAQALGESWDKHDIDTFISLFADDGVLCHPLFNNNPLDPRTAIDVLNSKHRGSTRLVNVVNLGNGFADFYFEDTGDVLSPQGVKPPSAIMRLTAKIENKRFKSVHASGYTIKSLKRVPAEVAKRKSRMKYTSRDIDAMPLKTFAKALGEVWAARDMDSFLNFFAEDAVIVHPLFNNLPLPAKTVADFLSSINSGRSNLVRVVDLGKGVADLYFEESGREGLAPGAKPPVATMKLTIVTEKNRIREIHLTGYTVERTRS